MLFWGCGCLEEAVAPIAVFVILLGFVVVVVSKFKNEDLISPFNWELIVEPPEALGFVLSVLLVVVFATPVTPNAAVMGGGGGANCGGGGTVGELADCLVDIEEDFNCCWGEDDASLPTEALITA